MKPILLQYFITNRCNAACMFCGIWKETPKIDARPDEVIRNLTEARNAGCSFVDFTGGEPLLHHDLPLFLSEAKRLRFITSVTTNCIRFPERARELNGLVDLLHFSLDADTKELHNKLRGSDSFDRVMESIPLALAEGLVPDLLFTYTDENIASVSGVYELARKNRLMVILDPVFSLDGKDVVRRDTHAEAAAWAKKPGVYLNRALLRLRATGGNRPDKNVCRAASSTIVILPDNRLALPCFHHAKDLLRAGASLEKSLSGDIRARAIKNQGVYPFCKGCHINCYFDPSFVYLRNALFLMSLAAKLKYAYTKYFIYGRKLPVFWSSKRPPTGVGGRPIKTG